MPNPVSQRIVGRVSIQELLQGFHPKRDRYFAGHRGVTRENQAIVLLASGLQLVVDQLQVEHVVGHEGPLLGGDAADDLAIGGA